MRVGFVLEAKIDVLNCWKFLKTHCYNEGIKESFNVLVEVYAKEKVLCTRSKRNL